MHNRDKKIFNQIVAWEKVNLALIQKGKKLKNYVSDNTKKCMLIIFLLMILSQCCYKRFSKQYEKFHCQKSMKEWWTKPRNPVELGLRNNAQKILDNNILCFSNPKRVEADAGPLQHPRWSSL